jgi:hypothetical protein
MRSFGFAFLAFLVQNSRFMASFLILDITVYILSIFLHSFVLSLNHPSYGIAGAFLSYFYFSASYELASYRLT